MAILGVCGGFVQPLRAEPPQSRQAQRPARAEASAPGRDITVTGQPPVTIGGTPARTPCTARDTTGRVTAGTAGTAGTADCAAAKLQDAASGAHHAASIDPTLAVPNARSPVDRVGVATVNSADEIARTNLRGRTSLPIRPVPPPPTSPFVRRP